MVIRKVTRVELEQTTAEPTIPTVSELTRDLKTCLEDRFSEVVVQGEISAWSRAASGHTYFTLKDERAILSGVLWRTRTLGAPIREGMNVVATGRITVYPPRGAYQLDAITITPLGQGDLQLAFEELKRRLAAEGLFEPAHKKPLPTWPRRIGVVTSPTGAAIRDIITTLRRRMPATSVVLAPAVVQGESAPEQIVGSIRRLDALGTLDVMIVGRGGGSLEDLWAFNDERVARALFEARTPTISAVGHEIDFTIADFVADVRAATPTAAAELAVRDRAEVIQSLYDIEQRLASGLTGMLADRTSLLESLLRSRGLSRPLDLVRSYQQRVDDLSHRTMLGLRAMTTRSSERLLRMDTALEALNPLNVLRRGYAIIERDGAPITRSSQLHSDDAVSIRLHDGRRDARIESDERR